MNILTAYMKFLFASSVSISFRAYKSDFCNDILLSIIKSKYFHEIVILTHETLVSNEFPVQWSK